jgi:hypothetical protein
MWKIVVLKWLIRTGCCNGSVESATDAESAHQAYHQKFQESRELIPSFTHLNRPIWRIQVMPEDLVLCPVLYREMQDMQLRAIQAPNWQRKSHSDTWFMMTSYYSV